MAWFVAWKVFYRQRGKRGLFEAVKKGKDPSLFVLLFEDSAALTGLLVALIGIALTDVTANPLLV